MVSRRQALVLAAVLTLTLFTGLVAIAGLARHHPAGTTTATVVRIVPSSATSAPAWADD